MNHVLRPRVRTAATSGLLVLSLLGLAACGSDEAPGSEPTAGLDSVKIAGDQGKEPKVTFDGRLRAPEDLQVEVLEEGDGPVVEGTSALVHWWIGNGFTEEKAQSTFAGAPQSVPDSEDVLKPLREGIFGHPVGSRVAVLSSAEDAFGEVGNAQIGIGNKDTVLFVIDIVGQLLTAPDGEDRKPAGWAPELIEEDGTVTGFDFSTGKAPSGGLLATTLVRGEGPVVKKGQTIYADYLGQVYKGKKPFDESFSKDPAQFEIGVGSVVEGWDETLVGRNVGSRLILQIPPEKGYGKEGNEQAGIKGTDTLYFVVDILGAA